ncbi:DNA repair exonuclease [Candidatus Amarobacter glycogenicus]|uniref:metallophosphoesterase family protein n=1 Tax=Candidatus Amarobacter glycogenicus TaxID=3140699 RepID=UPI002A0D6077|nr:DNA repair exonuclease [Dehalococcoidia bacterium]
MPERKPLRIVHTSDVHLGAYAGSGDAKWNARRELMELTFERVIDLANETNADALLIAGDFFDNDRVPEETVIFAAETIRKFAGQTFLIPGNHDPMDPGSIYWRHDMESIARRLTIVRGHKGELVEPEGLDLVLWGRAYLDTDWHFKPLDGLPERVDDRWHIAMGHGHFVREGGEMHRSLLIKDSEVAAAAGHWDYMAFGHWEPHADVTTAGVTAVYSGAPMPLTDANRKAGLAAVVDFNESGVQWTMRRVDPRRPEDVPTP